MSYSAVDSVGRVLEHRVGEALPARHDHVGAEAPDELLVLGLGVGDHPEALLLGKRDHVRGELPGAAGDRERVAGLQPEELEPEPRGQAVHRQRRRLDQGRAVGDRHHRRRRHDQQLLLRAALGPAGADRGHDLVADRQPVDVGPDRLDDAGSVHPRYPRRRQVGAAAALAQPDVGRVDGRGLDRDPDLAGAGLARRAVGDLEDVQVSGLGDDDGAQVQTSCVGVGAMIIDAWVSPSGLTIQRRGPWRSTRISPGCAGERYSISRSIESGSASWRSSSSSSGVR